VSSGLLVPRSDASEFRKRFRVLVALVLLAFVAVVARLFQLQVLTGAEYAAVARDNILRRMTVPTTRGVIRDSQGKVLASSRISYNVFVVPGRVMPSARPNRASRAALEPDAWPRVVETLRLNPDERSRFEERMRQACTTDEDRSPCWRTILVREDLDRDLVAEVRQHQPELPGVEIVGAPVRFYPFRNVASHTLGYVAEVDAETLAKVRPPGYEKMTPEERLKVNPLAYEAGDLIGATGVEHAWESYLRGQRGWQKRVVDARGRYRTGAEADRVLVPPVRQEPIPGRDLRLTIDVELMQSIERAMRGHPAGAVVVVDVRTGRVLGSYSKPDFDSDDLSGGSGKARVREAFARLQADPLRPLLDRAVSGAFQPGSTFKPFSAIAGLEDKLTDPEDHEKCDGYLSFGRRIFRCSHVHGKVNLKDAISESCNVFFFKLAEIVGIDRIAKAASEFGLGQKTGIGVNPESSGRIPTRSWYALRYRGQFRIGFTLNSSIGQGATTVTPVQLALAYAALANGGTLYLPQVVRAVETSDGAVVQDFPPRVRRTVAIRPDTLARINDALYSVVNDPKGTAYASRDDALDVAGKTGTAQTGNARPNEPDPRRAYYLTRDHAWFTSYYPAKAPEIAVVVLVEHGGSGPTTAVPIAMQIIREYARLSATRAGKPPPPPRRPPSDGHPQAAHVVIPPPPAAGVSP
jgi:penicillin-binding protein 2